MPGTEHFDQAAAAWVLAERRVALVVADLDEEDASFHEAAMDVHQQGFPGEKVQTWLKAAGFQEIIWPPPP